MFQRAIADRPIARFRRLSWLALWLLMPAVAHAQFGPIPDVPPRASLIQLSTPDADGVLTVAGTVSSQTRGKTQRVGINIKDHITLWYDANMPAKPVQVSIDLDLLRRIDADPETREVGRSAFIRSAVSSYLRAKRRGEIDAAIGRAYEGAGEAMLGDVSDLLDGQAWPDD